MVVNTGPELYLEQLLFLIMIKGQGHGLRTFLLTFYVKFKFTFCVNFRLIIKAVDDLSISPEFQAEYGKFLDYCLILDHFSAYC